MTFLTALGIITAFLGTGFGISKYLKDQEDQAKLEEAGKDPATLAQKQLDLSEKTSQENFDLAKEQFEYQKGLNQLTMDREDTAIQRQVADLRAAGLSPLALTGGANASVLTSAQAPQRDISGINTAFSNMIGAYNDAFSRKLQARQFRLQNTVQAAQAYTQLAELSMQRKRAKLENSILNLDYEYYRNHPERNLGLQQIVANVISNLLKNNPSAVGAVAPISLPKLKDEGTMLLGSLAQIGNSNKPSFASFGAVNPSSKYGHTLDNENYDNNRKTSTLIKDEIKEKYYKGQIKSAIASDNDYSSLLPKLYANDDYLKKHISLDNWKKASEDFILYYLKYGQFEGHKKYFE